MALGGTLTLALLVNSRGNAGAQHTGEDWTRRPSACKNICMPEEQEYEPDLWNALQKNGWRIDDAELVANFAAEFPDADVLSADVHASAKRLQRAAGVTAQEMAETALVSGPLWDEIGTDLTFQWAMHMSRGMGTALREWLKSNPYQE